MHLHASGRIGAPRAGAAEGLGCPAALCHAELRCDPLLCQVEDLLREALLLRAALDRGVAAGQLEKLLPKRYKQYQKGISGRV